nr:toll/interleukin-1 receptor domain-containing protein [uncultured Anaerosporobacter sp.]
MIIMNQLEEEIKKDIAICENYQGRNGSESLYRQLVAKYSVVDENFAKNLSVGKAVSVGTEFDFRPELKAVAAKLRMWLISAEKTEKNDTVIKTSIMHPTIFISHRSTDKEIADMLLSFFVGAGISRDLIFCSSLPGNDINEKISNEVKEAIKTSVVNIAILSHDYYKSAYCLNEAGIIWFMDTTPAIPVALPEVSSENMIGFLNNEYKIRRLDCEDDISYIYDKVRSVISAQHVKASIILAETRKLRAQYLKYISTRSLIPNDTTCKSITEVTTDDERIVLYYIISKNVRRLKKKDVSSWINEEEIYDVNIDNAFDLFASIGSSKITDDTLELDINAFREYSTSTESMLSDLLTYIENHRRLSRDKFETMWKDDQFNDDTKLFLAYIIEEKIVSFGDRWMADQQIEHIKMWEYKNSMKTKLSEKYIPCLSLFVQNNLVYESDWTSYGNPREHTLCVSLKTYLLSKEFPYIDEITAIKQKYLFELPF